MEALAIRGERIVATGDTNTIQAMVGSKTNVMHLHGATAIPGINDAHHHFDIGPAAVNVDLQTMDPAWRIQEKEKGTLEPGKLADIAVLSQDIFTVPPRELPKTVSVLTMVAGKVVYKTTDPNEAVPFHRPMEKRSSNNQAGL